MRPMLQTSLWVVLFVTFFSGESALGADGKTEVTVGAPVITGATAKTTITYEIDSTTQAFVSQSVTVRWIDNQTNPLRAHTTNFKAPPLPGKGPVSFDITYDITKGEIYRVDATMNYKDANGKNQSATNFHQQKY